MKPFTLPFIPVIVLCIICITTITLFGQKTPKGSFKDVIVLEFNAPHQEITIDYESEEVKLPIGDDCKAFGKKKKEISLDKIVPSSIVDIEYELINGERIVKEITSGIGADGEIELEGLLELVEKDIAFVDGYKIQLAKGAVIEGSKKGKCECKDMLFASLNDPLLKPGRYFLELKGKINEQGIIVASEVEACKNVLLPADQKLREAVENSYNTQGLAVVNKPTNLPFDVSLPLHNGNIKIGQYSYKLLDDIRIQGYVNSVGERLIPEHQKNLPEGDANKLNFRFYVIDNPIPNAFAFPNGMIFVHTGILDIMENEAELAVVLGHEIAHVTHEHGREKYETNIIASTVGSLGSQLLNRYSLQFNISQQLMAIVNETYSALRPEGLANIFNPQPARESQSDRVGLQYALMAGYDVREAIGFWNKMTKLTDDGSFKAKLGSNFRNMLASSNFSYGNPLNTLGELGFNVLGKMFLETVYTSHPKSKARAQALNQLILNGYKNEDLNSLDKGKEAFGKYVKGVK